MRLVLSLAVAMPVAAALLASQPALAQSKKVREQMKAEAAAEEARIQALIEERKFEPVLARCQARAERNLKRNRVYDAFRWDEAPQNAKTARPFGKFTPRQPIDVESILKLPGELHRKKDDTWVEGEVWCGIEGDAVRATDVFGPGERR